MRALRGAGPLVGRADELDTLLETWNEVRSGGSASVAVVGEAGIGKTSVLNALRAQLRRGRATVLTGRATEMERDVPFGIFADALDARAREIRPGLPAALGAERMAELSAVLPSMSHSRRARHPQVDAERYRAHHAVAALLEFMVTEEPVALLLDDVHWADAASLELLSHLMRRELPGVLTVLAYRPREAPPRLVSALEGRHGRTAHVELGPLSREDAAQILVGLPPARLRALHAESGGNPFYLTELARGRSERTPADGIPLSIADSIRGELRRLDEDVRRFAHGCSTVGDPFEVDLAATVAGVDEGEALRHVDVLVARDVVRTTETPRHFAFRHPIVRKAVYDAAPAGWRIAAHARAAAVLAARGAPPGSRAHHLERSAATGDDAAIAVLIEAGSVASARAPEAAAHWYRAALRLLPAESDDRHLPLLRSLANALAASGRLVECRDTLARIRRLTPREDVVSRVRATILVARAEQHLGLGEHAGQLLATSLAEVAPGSAEAVDITLELAENHLASHDWHVAERTATEAWEMAGRLGDPSLRLAADTSLATVLTVYGDRPGVRAAPLVDRAAAVVNMLPDDVLAKESLPALTRLTYSEIALERWTDALRHAERGLRLSRETGHSFFFPYFLDRIASIRMFQGRLTEAREAADASTESAHLLGNDHAILVAEALRSWVMAVRGDGPEALVSGERAARAADRSPGAMFTWVPTACYGEALIHANHLEEGRTQIWLLGGRELSALPLSMRPRWFRLLTEAAVGLGEFDEAAETVRLAAAAAERLGGMPWRDGEAHSARATLALARGEPGHAVSAARRALDRYTAARTPADVARARLQLGQALAAAGDPNAARRELRVALAEFGRCGADGWADRVAGELRGLGERLSSRRGPVRTDAILTRREGEVAKRIARGYTNRQIARELFISEKTVEAHVTRMFAKLGVNSRVLLAVELRRLHEL